MVDRLDEERLEILRSWGVGLAADGREEVRAAGKAITVLVDEIELLQVDLWNARVASRDQLERDPGLRGGLTETLAERLLPGRAPA